MSTYSTEHSVKVWNDKTGDHVYIGPDSDGLDLLEIRRTDKAGHEEGRIIMTKEEALAVAEGIKAMAELLP